MRSPTTEAAHLAALLTAATGHEPRITGAGELIRIEVDLPDELSETASRTILAALGSATRFGYERADGHAYVWATLSRPTAEEYDVGTEPLRYAPPGPRTRRPEWLPLGNTIETVPAGVFWNAVRVPADVGEKVLRVLGEFTGAVIEDRSAQTLYWLVPPRAAREWGLPGVEILGIDAWVGVPGPSVEYRCRWRISVDDAGPLTEPDALRTALVAVLAELGDGSPA
ncbi:hypothetical protein ACGFSB_17655 [Streptomyces sp. NPDC048441]|uniref:hypothetical protein n=1 Tax=Streptomyces sp. NPDC048441 TaxID=3365552 RepID=UPI003719A786